MDEAEGEERSVKNLTVRILTVNFAAIHTSSMVNPFHSKKTTEALTRIMFVLIRASRMHFSTLPQIQTGTYLLCVKKSNA